jgi:hypothetical protein
MRSQFAILMPVMLLTVACNDLAPSLTDDATAEPLPVAQTLPGDQYVPIDSNVANPERGFYVQRVGYFPEQLDWVGIDSTNLRVARDSGMSVVRTYFVFSDHRNRPLSAGALDSVRRTFRVARGAGLKVIPRFAYNFGDAPDAPVDVVLQHITQLGAVLRENADVIAFVESGFIGYWGEWHSSTNGLIGPGQTVNANTRAILERELAEFPANRMLAVRTPWQKRQLLGATPLSRTEAFSGTARARVGAHNDCFLASDTDWGTYSSTDPRIIEEEKSFLNTDNRYLPQGGETCNEAADAQPYIGCTNALVDLARMRYSVLNEAYHPGVNRRWLTEGCMAEVRRRLGYRFELLAAAVSPRAESRGKFRFEWRVRNNGFASPYNARGAQLVLRAVTTGNEVRIPLGQDVRWWAPGDEVSIAQTLSVPTGTPVGRYELFLHFPDASPTLASRPDYAIRLANRGVWEARTGYNRLDRQLLIR